MRSLLLSCTGRASRRLAIPEFLPPASVCWANLFPMGLCAWSRVIHRTILGLRPDAAMRRHVDCEALCAGSYGLVNFSDKAAAESALNALAGQQIDGRDVAVR